MKLRITVEGKEYEVEVEVADQAPAPVAVNNTPRAAAPARPSAPAPAAPAGGPQVADDKAVKSPLMGVCQAIEVSVGQAVEPDQPLVVLEAMKMLTTITSPSASTIKAIHVALGDSVKQGQVLIEFE